MRRILKAGIYIGLFFCGCLSSLAQAGTHPQMSFPYQKGWLGADAAYSIPLDAGHDLWLFGDTYVGAPDAMDRKNLYGMPRNSVGISECSHGTCTIQYYWHGQNTKNPKSFFDTGTTDWYWPLDGFLWNGTLYVMLQQMHAQGTGAFGFDYSGSVLATIPNYKEPPSHWRISYQSITTGNLVMPGVAIVLGERSSNPYPSDPNGAAYAYFFTYAKTVPNATFTGLTRLPLATLKDAGQAAGHWQYLSTASGWKPWTNLGKLPSDVAHVMSSGYTEMTVKYHPASGRWLAVMPSPIFFDPRGVYSLSSSIAGPWSEVETLYSYPEMQRSNPNYTKNVFCYADKEHPELEEGNSLVFTYACNSMVEADALGNMNLYHPVLLSRSFPER